MAVKKISKEEALEIILERLKDQHVPENGPPVSLPPMVIKRLHAGHRRENTFLARSMTSGGHKVIRG